MPVVEVACPGCGAVLKAPANKAGKKARCGKCGKPFRLPGPPPATETAGDGQALSVLALPTPVLPEDGEVAMAEPVEAVPATNTAALPSADPFDFSKPATTAPKTAFGDAKRAAPKPALPALPAPVPAAAISKATIPAAVPVPTKAKPEPEPLPLDDDDFEPIEPPTAAAAKAKPAPTDGSNPFAANPFSLSEPAAKSENPARSKRRDKEEEKPAKAKRRDEDERPAKSKRRREDDEEEKPAKSQRPEDDRPAKAKRRTRDEEEGEPPRSNRKKREAREEPTPAKSGKAAPAEQNVAGGSNPFAALTAPNAAGGSNPFSALTSEPETPAKSERPAKSKRRDEDDDEPETKPKKNRPRDEDEPDDEETPRYRRPAVKAGTGKMLLITAIAGLLALGLGIAAIVVYAKSNRKEPEQAKKEEKKEETPAPSTNSQPAPKVEPKVDPKVDPKVEPKPKDTIPNPKMPKDPDPAPVPLGPRPAITFNKLKTFNVGVLPPKVEPADKPQAGGTLEVPLGKVKRVFPPFDAKSGDTCVLIQTNAGFNGKGERLALDSYGPAGNRVPTARIEYDGDGLASPIADLHASTKGVFFLAAVGGKIHVWALADKSKRANGINPYAEKPEHAKAGLAAAFFSPDPDLIVTVSTAGAILLYDLNTSKAVADFVPLHGTPGTVALGQSIAVSSGHESVAVAVAGILYQLKTTPTLAVQREYDIGGDVGRSIALAVTGAPGRLLYVFESPPDKAGKKEKVVLGLPLGDAAKHIAYQFPATAGEPKGALWANELGGVVTDRGVLWFNGDEKNFLPLVFTQPPAAGLYFGDDKSFWFVIPHPKEATKSVMVALAVPFTDFAQYQKNYPTQPLRAVKIDHNGLAQ